MATRYPRHTASEWEALIDQQQRSGCSLGEFCKRNDLARSTFTYWKRRLAGGAASNRSQPIDGMGSAVPLFTALAPGSDAAVEGTASGPSWEVDLDLGNGVRLSIRRVA